MTTIQTANYFLNRMLANLRTELLQDQTGRAILDTLPEDQRRMLKQATAY